MADTTTLDDIVKPENKEKVKEGLENKINETPKTGVGDTIEATFGYGLLTGLGYLSYLATGLAGPVTGIAMMFGRVLLDMKKRKKTDWYRLYKEGLKGLILGNFTKLFYQYIVSTIPNKTIYGKAARLLSFNPGYLGAVYHPTYLKTTHMLQGKAPEKGEWARLVKRNFLYLSPFHYLTTNYLKNVQQQAAASAFLGTAYRIIAG